MTRRVALEEGILIGGSGGMAVVGALNVARRRPDDLVVVIIPDSGRNYISRVFNDDWMREKGMLDD
ncbi:putative cystathionine beta-synthase [bacterium BMS3Bbin02]|nr:putative cystathionine beta-synthase [bacterium BMS3Bbin02]